MIELIMKVINIFLLTLYHLFHFFIEALKVLSAIVNLVEDEDNLISLLWGKLVH